MNALDIRGLRKTYANNHIALQGIDLSVKQGEFFALLGPNGAGKSTLIGIVSSLINKTGGEVKIFGVSIDQDVYEAKRHIGIVPQEFNFSMFEPVIEIVANQAGYYGIANKEAHQRAEKYLKQLDLWDKRHSISRELSGGMKRRLMIARALVHEPRLLILDEPTAGVDIEIRRSMWQFLQDINRQGTTIILTTHYLEEAESLCERLAIIDAGKIVKEGVVNQLITQTENQTYVFDISIDQVSNQVDTLDRLHRELTVVSKGSTEGQADNQHSIEIELTEGSALKNVFAVFAKHGIEVRSMRNKYNRLEEFFLNLVNK